MSKKGFYIKSIIATGEGMIVLYVKKLSPLGWLN